MESSVELLCRAYFTHINKPFKQLPSWYFCDNEHDANECAALVLSGIKQATSPSLWWYEDNNEPLPEVGDLNVVTNWQGEGLCIIETTAVDIVPFNEISAQYAYSEGEGDRSLSYWQDVHWQYYHRELVESDREPTQDMPIVCEAFRVVFSQQDIAIATG